MVSFRLCSGSIFFSDLDLCPSPLFSLPDSLSAWCVAPGGGGCGESAALCHFVSCSSTCRGATTFLGFMFHATEYSTDSGVSLLAVFSVLRFIVAFIYVHMRVPAFAHGSPHLGLSAGALSWIKSEQEGVGAVRRGCVCVWGGARADGVCFVPRCGFCFVWLRTRYGRGESCVTQTLRACVCAWAIGYVSLYIPVFSSQHGACCS